MQRARRRFGAILWDGAADMDDAIRLVEAFDDPNAAATKLARTCSPGEKWAVVEIPSMRVVAWSGPAPR